MFQPLSLSKRTRLEHYYLHTIFLFLQLVTSIIINHQLQSFQPCYQSFNKFIFPITIIMIGVNFLWIWFWNKTQQWKKNLFIVGLSVNLVAMSVMFLLYYSQIHNKDICGKDRLLATYSVLQILAHAIISLIILFSKFSFAILYTSSPGNLIWCILLIIFSIQSPLPLQLQLIIYITLLICVTCLALQIICLFTGFTPIIKKLILIHTIISLVLTILSIVLGWIMFFQIHQNRKQAKQNIINEDNLVNESEVWQGLAVMVAVIGIIQLAVWIWLFIHQTFQNGQKVKDVQIMPRSSIYDTSYQYKHQVQLDQHQWVNLETQQPQNHILE